jgi:large subunit ribosomal protein L30
MAATLRVTYTKSAIGYSQRQKDTIRCLGLRKLGQTVEVPDTGAIRGMVRHVQHLVTIEEAVPAQAGDDSALPAVGQE